MKNLFLVKETGIGKVLISAKTTTEFNNAIASFVCDFNLAIETKDYSFANLGPVIKKGDEKLLQDIQLLSKLSHLLRTEKAEIVLK